MLGGDRRGTALSVVTLAISLSVPLSFELALGQFKYHLRDEEGKWLGADLVLMAREPVEELGGTPLILETVANVGGQALHIKVTDAARLGAQVAEDAAQRLGVKLGDRFAFGQTHLHFHSVLRTEADRFIGMGSTLPRILISHADWESSGLGAFAAPPEYRYLFFNPSPGRKQELMKLYPGALILSKEDRFGSAEANTQQVQIFVRAAAALAASLGVAGIYLLGRLQVKRRLMEITNLKLLGATPACLRCIELFRALSIFALASIIALPLCYALIELQRLRMGYFLPLARTSWLPSLPFCLAWILAGILSLAANLWAGQENYRQRPGGLLRDEARDVSRLQKWAMFLVIAFASAVSGGLASAYSEFLPVFAQGAFPSEDGVLVIGDGPPATREIQSVWARVNAPNQEQHTALATCGTFREGVLLETAFAKRLHLQVGDFVPFAVGRKRELLRVEAIENARGVAQFLRQAEIPCRLAEGLPRFRLAWHSGPAESIRQQLPKSVVSLTATELRSRVDDLASRSIFLPRICAIYVTLMSLLIVGATWRMLLLARKNEFAIWRVFGASRSSVAKRIAGRWIWPLIAALGAGGTAAWAWASALVSFLAGTRTYAPLYWIPLIGALWGAIILAVWRFEIARLLRDRPMKVLGAI